MIISPWLLIVGIFANPPAVRGGVGHVAVAEARIVGRDDIEAPPEPESNRDIDETNGEIRTARPACDWERRLPFEKVMFRPLTFIARYIIGTRASAVSTAV
jgi:hypothetical protein